MTTCLLIRHGQSQANVDGILAGRTESDLTEDGWGQIRRLAKGLFQVRLSSLVTSPLERCAVTASEICSIQAEGCQVEVEERVAEVQYGAWTGKSLKDLAAEELWKDVQSAPSTVTFPADPDGDHDHESLSAMSDRAWEAWQQWDERIEEEHGEHAVWAMVSHGDVIKALLARAMGLPLDSFQSIIVDPASVSIIERQKGRTAVRALNLRDDVYPRLGKQQAEDPDEGAEIGVVGGGDG